MTRVAYIQFKNHPVLGNLKLNFCGRDGKPVDTVIIAGENGVGKSNIINAIYNCTAGNQGSECKLGLWKDDLLHELDFKLEKERNYIYIDDEDVSQILPISDRFKNKYQFYGVFSDVDISFHSKPISNVTSMNLDNNTGSRKSEENLAQQVKQLLIDIQALDDAAIGKAARENPDMTFGKLDYTARIPRFTRAFSYMFDDLEYDRIENINNSKTIFFKKNGKDVSLDDLSSGEKQIVFRGCFLLRDVNALNGAVVFIDEPEISLHPNWQKKILDYYKDIFTDKNGVQTSQMFVVTHSPFIIHNENRKNDKVIVLTRDKNGGIGVKDKPEYYYCNSMKAIEDAFFIKDFSASESFVYVEGRTDEKYFSKAVEVFNLDVPFRFKWVGHLDNKGQEVFTGKDSVNKAYQFLVSRNLAIKNICLLDFDTKAENKEENNVLLYSISKYENSKGFDKGIENALILDEIWTDIQNSRERFYLVKEIDSDYGEHKSNEKFQKMEFCDYIYGLSTDKQKNIMLHLKEIIEELKSLYNQKN